MKFPLYEITNNSDVHNYEEIYKLLKFDEKLIENCAENFPQKSIQITQPPTTIITTTTNSNIDFHHNFNKNKLFPFEYENDNLPQFPTSHSEAYKPQRTNNNNNKDKLYNEQKYSIIENDIQNNHNNNTNNNNNNQHIGNKYFENNAYENNDNDVMIFSNNSIKKSMTPLKIDKDVEEEEAGGGKEILILNNFCCEKVKIEEQNEAEERKEEEEDKYKLKNMYEENNILQNNKNENQVRMPFNKNHNNNNNNSHNDDNNENFMRKKQEEKDQQSSKQIENNFHAKIDNKILIMKAKVENIETQTINKISVEEKEEEEQQQKISVEEKENQRETMLITTLMSENNSNEKQLQPHPQQQQQQQEEYVERNKELLIFNSSENYESNNSIVNRVKPELEQTNKQHSESKTGEKEKQSEQLNESTPTTETTTMKMMMIMNPTIAQIIISSYGAENSDVHDQLSQEVHEHLTKQYNNKNNHNKNNYNNSNNNNKEGNIDANQLLINYFDDSRATSTFITSTLTTTTTSTTDTTTSSYNKNNNDNNTIVINDINVDDHIVNSEVNYNNNFNNNNNNNNNNNYNLKEELVIEGDVLIENRDKNKAEEEEEGEKGKLERSPSIIKTTTTIGNDDNEKDNLEDIEEMKLEMRSALANHTNTTSNNNKNNSIVLKQQQQQQTKQKIPDVRLTRTSLPTSYKYAPPTTTAAAAATKTTTSAAKYNYATNIPTPLTTKTIGSRTTTAAGAATRTYIPISQHVNTTTTPTTTTTTTTYDSNDRSMSLDTSLILPERTRLRRQRRMLSQGSIAEQNEDPVERLNRLRARISGALSQVKGVLKQYSTDVDANEKDEENSINSTNSDVFRNLSRQNNSKRLTDIALKYGKTSEIENNCLKNEMPTNTVDKELSEMGKNENEGPVSFRFVRKVRRRSTFNENDGIKLENPQLTPNDDNHNTVKLENESTTNSEIQDNLVKERNEKKHDINEVNESCEKNDTNSLEEKESMPIHDSENVVKKLTKKRVIVIKKSKVSSAARRASIAAVESSKIEPTIKKLLPVHIKAQRRPSDSVTLVNHEKMLMGDKRKSLTKNQLNDIASGMREIGSMDEQEKNDIKKLKVNHEINATPSVSLHYKKTRENVANDIGMNNDYTHDNSNNINNSNNKCCNNNNNNNKNINNYNNKNSIIIKSVNENENENSNKDNHNKNTTTATTTTSDIALMLPVNCSSSTLASGEETSITIVKLIDDAGKLLGVTAGDNVNLSMNNKDATNQINTRQLIEDASRTSTKLDDKQSTDMVAMLMLSPLQDVVTNGGGCGNNQQIHKIVNSELINNNKNDNQQIITETIQEPTVKKEEEQSEKSNVNKNIIQVLDIEKVISKVSLVKEKEEEKNFPIESKTTTKASIKLPAHSSSSTAAVAAAAAATEIFSKLETTATTTATATATASQDIEMPELQVVPVPVQLSEHNDKLRNAESPFNDIKNKDDNGKKRVVLKKFIRKNSIDKATVLKKLTKIQKIPESNEEHIDSNTIDEVTIEKEKEKDTETEAETKAEVTIVSEAVNDKIVQIKAPRKIKKKVIIKRQQRRLSVSDTGFFREPVNDEQTDGTASDIEILEKPISYVTDDDESDIETDAKKKTNEHVDHHDVGDDDDVGIEAEQVPEIVPLKSCMKAREFQVDDWVMYAERFKKTMVRWKKGRVIERITSISYKLDIDGKEVPAHISYIKKHTDRKVNFGCKEYLEINYEHIEQEKNDARSYSIWNMV